MPNSLGAALLLAATAAAPKLPAIPYETFRLPNGLNVILSEDHTAPIVGVDVRYSVGSKDERPGRTGFAHLFEHLMFQGSVHYPKGEADRLLEAVGGVFNGGTSPDATVYWGQVPSNALELVLAIESDRMGFLLPVIDQAKLDNQRDVVLNERRQNLEMQPYGKVWEVLPAELWDASFPYHWPTIGFPQDISAATLDDVREFFRRYYGPGDASLAIAGDFDPKEARRLVERWFGPIAGASAPQAARTYPTPEPLAAERRVTIEDDVQLPRLYIAWQSPKSFAPGDAELDLAADVLADGKSARLVQRLVMDERIAQNVSAGQMSAALASTFLVVATPKPGTSLTQLEREIDEELARLAGAPPAPGELERAVNKTESGAVFSLEPVGGDGGRAATLNRYFQLTGDPGYFPKDVGRYRAVTPAAVSEAVGRFLRKDARVVLAVVPRGSVSAGGAPAGSGSKGSAP
jgi:zinc protease